MGRRGAVYELHGHRRKVTSLAYRGYLKRLMSAGENSRLVSWVGHGEEELGDPAEHN